MNHYFSRQPTAPSHRRRVEIFLPDISLQLTTDRGVFSPGKVDAGTKFLLCEAPRPDAGCTDLVDLGCGYGAIACALAMRAPAATVWAVDVNTRALQLCRENAQALGLENVIVADPGQVPAEARFDLVYSNPPVRVGKPALQGILSRWFDLLREGGHAYLVINKHLGADSLSRWLAQQGWLANRIGSRQGYRLLDVSRRSPD